MSEKKCITCCDIKSFSEFSKNRTDCKKCVSIYQKEYRIANKDKLTKQNKKWRKINQESRQAYDKEYAVKNKEQVTIKKEEWRQKNLKHSLEKNRINGKLWRENNRDKCAAKRAKRRSIERNAVPVWYDTEKDAITELYKERANWVLYGVDAHVDHIVPLQHKLVCGLHTLANLQVITAYENLSKHNKFEV